MLYDSKFKFGFNLIYDKKKLVPFLRQCADRLMFLIDKNKANEINLLEYAVLVIFYDIYLFLKI